MSDAALRELERVWRITHLVDDEAAYLRARLRTGNIGAEQLRLAAYCGHPAALRVAPVEPVDFMVWRLSRSTNEFAASRGVILVGLFDRWVNGLQEWGEPVLLRAVLAAAAIARVADCYENNPHCARSRCMRVRSVAKTIEEYLACPCPRHRQDWERKWVDIMFWGLDWLPGPGTTGSYIAALHAAAAQLGPDAPMAPEVVLRGEVERALIEWALA